MHAQHLSNIANSDNVYYDCALLSALLILVVVAYM